MMSNGLLNPGQLRHLAYERAMWLRALDYIQQENIHQKNRMAEIMMDKIDPELLEQAEYFQNQFLNKDAVVAILRNDIAQAKELNGDVNNKKNLKMHQKLRQDMEMMEKEFSRLKFEFSGYLLQALNEEY